VYGHLSQVNVSVCQGVAAGQGIGLSGSTGNSTGAHLHFETRLFDQFVNPWTVLPAP
jgi:murein DD-endopeptidase MepM/ murein hydrolase activator NlpD